jgi:hypothetical protein
MRDSEGHRNEHAAFQRGRPRIHRPIMDNRQEGASLGLIRELLATVGVAVSTATMARFSGGGEPQFNVSTTTSAIRSRTHSCSEHNPSATYRRFAGDHQLADERRDAESHSRLSIQSNYGRGGGVGRVLGVTFGLAVGVALAVAVGVAVGVALGVIVDVAVAVAVAVGVAVGGIVAVGVGLAVAVGVGVGVGGGCAQYLPPVFKKTRLLPAQ